MPKLPKRSIYLILSIAFSTASMAAQVIELQPGDVASFVAKNPHAVIQFTSPDRKCTYCIGADKVFDQAAAVYQGPPMVFGRVQWSTWHKIPDFSPLLDVYGVPEQFVFKNGKEVGGTNGRAESAQKLLERIQKVIDTPVIRPTSPATNRTSEEAAPQALSAAEQALTKLQVRHDFFSGVAAYCAKQFPASAQAYRDGFEAWRGSRQSALGEAARVFLNRSSHADAAETGRLIAEEKTRLQDWQTKQLGISIRAAPTAEDCMKVAQGMRALATVANDLRTAP